MQKFQETKLSLKFKDEIFLRVDLDSTAATFYVYFGARETKIRLMALLILQTEHQRRDTTYKFSFFLRKYVINVFHKNLDV